MACKGRLKHKSFRRPCYNQKKRLCAYAAHPVFRETYIRQQFNRGLGILLHFHILLCEKVVLHQVLTRFKGINTDS